MTSIVEPMVMWSPVDPPRPGTLIPSKVYWQDSRPLEITVIFGDTGDTAEDTSEDGNLIRWVFSRDLLADADRAGTAGMGDVHIQILTKSLMLSLTSPFGTIKLRTDAAILLKFLKRTYIEVSMSDEFDYLPLTDSQIHEQMLDWGLM